MVVHAADRRSSWSPWSLRDRLRAIPFAALPLLGVAAAPAPAAERLRGLRRQVGPRRRAPVRRDCWCASPCSWPERCWPGSTGWLRDRALPPRRRRLARHAGGSLVVVAGAAAGAVVATHGHPVRFVVRQWNGFSHQDTRRRPARQPFRRCRQRSLRLLAGRAGRLRRPSDRRARPGQLRRLLHRPGTQRRGAELDAQPGDASARPHRRGRLLALRRLSRSRPRRRDRARRAARTRCPGRSRPRAHAADRLGGARLGGLVLGDARAVRSGARLPRASPARWPVPESAPRPVRVAARPSSGAARSGLGGGAVAPLRAATFALGVPYLATRQASIASDTRGIDPRAALADLHEAADLDPLNSDVTQTAGAIALQIGDLPSRRGTLRRDAAARTGRLVRLSRRGAGGVGPGQPAQRHRDFALAVRIDHYQPASSTRCIASRPLTLDPGRSAKPPASC